MGAPAVVVVYGGTPAGCAAAIAAARMGANVTLVEPSPLRVGGMTAGGLGHTDLGLQGREIGGITREFYERVSAHYGDGSGSQCYQVEPHVAQLVYDAMLAEAGVRVLLGTQLLAVTKQGSELRQISVEPSGGGGPRSGRALPAAAFVDASYEGDLMAGAGVTHTVGRESSAQYGEETGGRLAPNDVLARYQFQQSVRATDEATGALLPLVYGGAIAPVGGADAKVQAYCFRPCMAKLAGGNAVPPPPPRLYRPEQWQLFRNLLATAPAPENLTASDFLYFAGPLGNSSGLASKFDVGTSGPINLDFIGESWEYPAANYSRRRAIRDAHAEYTLGLLYFLGRSNDSAVPAGLRDDVLRWGLCADEFARREEGHFPRTSLYVREARRMLGERVLVERDRVSARTKNDSIGVGSYNCDVHMVERIVVNGTGWVKNEGWLKELFEHTPWEIPFSALRPRAHEASNLLVPVALSASHVAFNGVRLEPTWSILGHAAGVAAAMVANASGRGRGARVGDVDVVALQRELRAQGQFVRADELPSAPPPQSCAQSE